MTRRAKPTPEYITALNDSLKNTWDKQIKEDEKALQVINREHKVDVPKARNIEGFKPIIYHAGTGQDALDRYCGFIGKLIFQVERGFGSRAQERSEEAEDFFQHILWDYEAREGPFFYDLKEGVLATGRVFLEVAPKPVYWTKAYGKPSQGEGEDEDGETIPEKETGEDYKKRLSTWKKRIARPPISFTLLPGSSVRVVLSHNKPIEYVQEAKMTLGEAANRWPRVLKGWQAEIDDKSSKVTEEITVLKYGNDTWISVLVDRNKGWLRRSERHEVSHYPHGMGVCPLAMFEGFKSVKKEPGFRWRSIISKAMDAILMVDEMRSRAATALKLMPMPQYYIRVKQAMPDEEPPPIIIDPTVVRVLYSDEEPGVLEAGHPPPEAEALDTKVRDEIEWLLPEIAKGMTGAAGTPAWSDRLKLDQVRNYLKPVLDGIALGGRQTAQLICKAIMSPRIGEAVYVRMPGEKGSEVIGLSPKEAADVHDRVTCLIHTKLPSDVGADIGRAQLAYDFGMPWSWCVEEIIGAENPMELRKRRMIEELEDTEPYKQSLYKEVLAEADILDAEDAAMGAEELMRILPTLPQEWQETILALIGGAPPGAPPGGMTPPGPSPAPPGAGPGSLAKTGQLTREISGPKPTAPFPGGPSV